MAREEWKLSEPPRRIAALPACRQSPPASAVTLGRDFVDDADDAERHAHARDVEAVGPRPVRRSSAPTGSGRAATSSRPLAIASTRLSSSISRSSSAARQRRLRRRRCRWRWRRGSPALSARIAARRGVSAAVFARGVGAARARAAAVARGRAERAHRRRRDRSGCRVHRRSSLTHHEIVAVDHLVAATVAEHGLDFTALVAGDARGRRRRNRRRGRAPISRPSRSCTIDRVAALELALDRR